MTGITEDPEQLKKLKAQYENVNASVEQRRQNLQLDKILEFVSQVTQFKDRPPLHFRKLRFAEVIQVQGMMPNIPVLPEDATDEQMAAWWNQISNEDKLRMHETMSTALSLATKDGYALSEFNDMEDPLVIEAFKILWDFSGYSDQAVEDLTWFRRSSRRPDSR